MGLIYSFMDVMVFFFGLIGEIDLGYGFVSLEEGIIVVMGGFKNIMIIGVDGEVMYSLYVDKSGMVIVNLLKILLINKKLLLVYNVQSQFLGIWGNNVIVI